MRRFPPAHKTWWRKPLVLHQGRETTAELAILYDLTGGSGRGVWMNSRGKKTGVVRLVRDGSRASGFRTERSSLPDSVARTVSDLYDRTGLGKGCPDLVIWDRNDKLVRLVEVKHSGTDVESEEQKQFMAYARKQDIWCETVGWEFATE